MNSIPFQIVLADIYNKVKFELLITNKIILHLVERASLPAFTPIIWNGLFCPSHKIICVISFVLNT
ncbi:hypothetical protein NIES2101_12015 [Calothrix sp. HK-06]|nr:hypothetical protein NIES2101_12015 [Calothrix sp. HK-06]